MAMPLSGHHYHLTTLPELHLLRIYILLKGGLTWI